MRQEFKQLLLKDLAARLPYGVMIEVYGESQSVTESLHNITDEGKVEISYTTVNIETIKPYLRTMSSLTKEEIEHILSLRHQPSAFTHKNIIICANEVTKYLYSRHVDICGLIPLGLALEAPKDMYKF